MLFTAAYAVPVSHAITILDTLVRMVVRKMVNEVSDIEFWAKRNCD